MDFTATLKKVVDWKNGKGQFLAFEEHPNDFWKWETFPLKVGVRYNVVSVKQPLGTDAKKERIMSIVEDGQKQTSISSKSPIVEAQKSTGATLRASISQNDFVKEELDQTILNEVQNLKAVVVKILERIEELERDNKIHFIRENILQNKCKVSYV